MEIIKFIGFMAILPYFCIGMLIMGWRPGSNNGHMAGIGDGFMVIGAVVSAVVQIVLAALFLLIFGQI